jgi:WD40 repeat protein
VKNRFFYHLFLLAVVGKTFSSEPLLYAATALSQPTKKIVSQLRPDGTMHYYTKENNCITSITRDGSHCLSFSGHGVVELYDLQNKTSKLIKTGYDICSPWTPLLTSDKSLLIAPGTTERSLRIINTLDQRVLYASTCDGSIINVAEDHGNKRLYVAYGINQSYSTEDFCLTIIDLSTMSIKEDIRNIKRFINSISERTKIAVDTHGKRIAFGDANSISIYDITSRSAAYCCPPSQGTAGTSCIANAAEIDFHPYKNYIAFCNSAGQVFEYDLRNDSRNWRQNSLYSSYSITYDKMGNGLICGGASELAILKNEGEIDYRIKSPDSGKVQSVYLNKDSDTWFASTSHNILMAGTLSALKQNKDREMQELARRAEYDQFKKLFRLAYFSKVDKQQYGTWTLDHENELQEMENKLRIIGQELGINDFDQE